MSLPIAPRTLSGLLAFPITYPMWKKALDRIIAPQTRAVAYIKDYPI